MNIDRRSFFGLAGAAGIGAAVAVPSTLAVQSLANQQSGPSAISFYGAHQAGIATPMQDRAYVAAFKVIARDRNALELTLKKMTAAAERMSRGSDAGPLGAVSGDPLAPPDDTGEALDLPAARISFTIGFGASLFDERFGFAAAKPADFEALPKFAGDQLLPERVDGDLILQVCADDDQVAFHGIRNLIRLSKGTLEPMWMQSGFSGAARASGVSKTPRNLFGFKDGTANLDVNDSKQTNEHLWVQSGLFAGGTFMAVRNFRFDIETWDRSALVEQEAVFGRNKGEGAPLSGGTEFSTPDFSVRDSSGQTAIASDSHMALAHPSRHGGVKILRRAYNYSNGTDRVGRIDAGLLFISFQKDLERQFVPLQRALANSDRLNEYVTVIGSGAYVCPPGLKPGEYWGHQLFS